VVDPLRETLRGAAVVTLTSIVVVAGMTLGPPQQSPWAGDALGANLAFSVWLLPLGGFTVLSGVTVYCVTLINVSLGWRRMVAATAAGSGVLTVGNAILGGGFGVFPVPVLHMSLGVPACAVLLSTLWAGYPAALREDAAFRRTALCALACNAIAIASAMGLVVFNAFFQQARGQGITQSLLALGLPVYRLLLKILVKRVTRAGGNPDFMHGSAFAIELEVSMLCAVIFTNIDSWLTFILLVGMDLVVNLGYVVMITLTVIHEQQATMRKLRQTNARLRSRLLSGGGGATGIEDEGEDKDEDPGSGALTITRNPKVAYLCANLYFAEFTECVGPCIMGIVSLIIYNLPNDNSRFISFMDPRLKTREEFLHGMVFVLLDATIEALTFSGLVAYMRRVVKIDPLPVGWFIVQRHSMFYFVVHLTFCGFFIFMFLRHTGCDPGLRFAWLEEGFMYTLGDGPLNSTSPLLWA